MRLAPVTTPAAAAVVVVALVLTATACKDAAPNSAVAQPRTTSDSTPPSPEPLPQLTRRIAPVPDHPRWIRGGSELDTLFAAPYALATADHHLYVLDGDTHRLSALRLADGSVDWQRGGPDDSTVTPVALTAAPAGGGVTVADATHGRLVTLDVADGRPTTAVPFGAAADARSLCALPDGSFLVAGADPAGALLRVSPTDPSPRHVPLPWPDLATRHRLATQVTLASSTAPPGGCVVALALGRGFAVYDGVRYVARQRYVEPFDLPGVSTTVRGDAAAYTRVERLDDTRLAARDVALSADRVAVAFDGGTAFRARVIDLYDRRSGAYMRSLSFAGRIAAVADDGHDLYVAFMRRGRAAIAVFPVPDNPPTPLVHDSTVAAR